MTIKNPEPPCAKQKVTNGVYTATYSYIANSSLVGQILFKSNAVTGMTTTKSYDNLNRLTSISSVGGASSASPTTFDYTYNNANQRTRRNETDGSYWNYQYDSLGQVISGKKYWADGTPVAGQQFEYGFDDIGNRNTTKSGGDEVGAALRAANYTANSLNQYTSRDIPGYVDVLGISFSTNTVTVNSQSPYRKGEYFRKELPVNNSSAALWTNVTVTATGQTPVSGNVFVARTAESFGYDLDGNLTNDGRWAFTWDAENRLVKIESLASAPLNSHRRVAWVYDGQGRRIQQTTYTTNAGSYVVTENLKFLSDGWRHIAELNATNNARVRSYTWGLDLSGSMDGAGGVGGLLTLNSVANGAHFYAYDGNGNVAALVRGADGTISANYEYEAFGKPLRSTGATASENPFRFSTKRTDNTSDFVLYEYRAYNPSTGRWLSRDPLEEDGGFNLFSFASADPIGCVDVMGLDEVTISADAFIPWEWAQLPSLGVYYLQIKGDGRLPGSSPPSIASHSYRTAQTITVELLGSSPGTSATVSLAMGMSDSTRRVVDSAGIVLHSYTHPAHLLGFILTSRRLSCTSVRVDLQMSGSVDWHVAGPQPAIDFSYSVILTQTGKDVSWDLTANHDGFPAHEFFIESAASTKVNFNYVPTWFTFVPPGPGSIATPSIWQAAKGTAALGGYFMHQRYSKHGTFSIP